MNKVLSHHRSTRRGNFVLELCKIADIYCVDWNEIATRYCARSMNKLLRHHRGIRKGNSYSSYAKLIKDNW
ncbi:hypothetical protein RDI58_017851 [Solanum bulbocastanum]|uniref:Uncharacterized protein n=1 Tax=Solanum bulbocastanum TaxID=147425 RepID=A0AAN8TFD5_SOLBU